MARKDESENSSETSAPDPWAVLEGVSKAIAALAEAVKVKPSEESSQAITILSAAVERMAGAQLEGSQLIAKEQRDMNKRTGRPTNNIVHRRSVFNRRGQDTFAPDVKVPYSPGFKPPLKCNMLIPFIVEWDSITREEVELLNLLQPGEYMLTLIDRSKRRMGVKVDYKLDGKTPSRLLMQDMDEQGQPGTLFKDKNTVKLLPPLADWIRQLLKQHEGSVKTADDKEMSIREAVKYVLTDEEEEALIEAGQLSVAV